MKKVVPLIVAGVLALTACGSSGEAASPSTVTATVTSEVQVSVTEEVEVTTTQKETVTETVEAEQEYTDTERAALEQAYGPMDTYPEDALFVLESMCAPQLMPESVEPFLSQAQVDEAKGMLILCPDHSQATGIKVAIADWEAAN